MKPLHSTIALRVEKPKAEKTNFGLILQEDEDKRAQTGVVIAVGRGRITSSGLLIPPSVKVGDVVAFKDFAIKKDDKWRNPNEVDDVYFVDESDIMAIIGDESPHEEEPVKDLNLERVAFPHNN